MNPDEQSKAAQPERLIVLYDGICNLCTASVKFIILRDPANRFAFAALQSDTGKALLKTAGLPEDSLETFVLIDHGHAYTRSDASLRIARNLSGLWPILSVLRIIPRPIRNGCYSFIARHRYRWFGRRESCLLSTPENSERFLK